MEIHLYKYDPELNQDILDVFRRYGEMEEGKAFYRPIKIDTIRFCISGEENRPADYKDGEVILSLNEMISYSVNNLWPTIHFLFVFLTIISYRSYDAATKEDYETDLKEDISPVIDTWCPTLIKMLKGNDEYRDKVIRILSKLGTMFSMMSQIFYGSPDACSYFDFNNKENVEKPVEKKTAPPASPSDNIEFVIAGSSPKGEKP